MRVSWLFPVLALALAAWPAAAVAQEQGLVVEGRVINGTGGDTPAVGLVVTLHRESVAGHKDLETETDEEGAFRFTEVEYDPAASYGVSVTYQGVLYGTDIDLSAGSPSPIELTVYEAVDDESAFSIEGASLLIVQADEPRTLRALEIVSVVNRSDTTYVPGVDPMKLLRFALPPQARDLSFETVLSGDAVQVDRGFALTSNIPPGKYEVMFSYKFPYEGSETVLPRSYPYGAESVRVLAPPEVGILESDDMGTAEEVVIGSDVYQILTAGNLPAGARLSVSLSGLSQPTFGDRVSEVTEKVRPEYAALAGLAVLMAVLLGLGLWKGGGTTAEEGDDHMTGSGE